MPERTRVAIRSSDLPSGKSVTVVARRREIVVFNVDGKLYAVFNRCPHHQAPLSEGRLTGCMLPGPVGTFDYDPDKHVIRCPWHHFEFDLESGRCPADPKRYRIATYEVRREDDEIALYV
jgi:nitrite reductase (NADH) small subunit